MEIIKIKKFEYRPSGIITYWKNIQKTVIIEGETYINNKYEDIEFDLDKSFKNKDVNNEWECEIHNLLSGYGIIIKTWKCKVFDKCHVENVYSVAFNFKDIPKYKISYIHYGKFKDQYATLSEIQKESLNRGVFSFKIKTYGFNNSINIEMPIRFFLSIPYESHHNAAKESIKATYVSKYNTFKTVLPKKYFEGNFNDIDRFKLLTEIFKYKLLLKQKLS